MGKLTLYVEDFLASLEQYDEAVKDGLKTELKNKNLKVKKVESIYFPCFFAVCFFFYTGFKLL